MLGALKNFSYLCNAMKELPDGLEAVWKRLISAKCW